MFRVVFFSAVLLAAMASSDISQSSITYVKKITLSFEEGMSRSDYQNLASKIKNSDAVRKVKVDHKNNEIIVTLEGDKNGASEELILKTTSDKSTPLSEVELEKQVNSESGSAPGYEHHEENEGESFNIMDLDFFSIFRNPLQ